MQIKYSYGVTTELGKLFEILVVELPVEMLCSCFMLEPRPDVLSRIGVLDVWVTLQS